jgi:hypothetical protein
VGQVNRPFAAAVTSAALLCAIGIGAALTRQAPQTARVASAATPMQVRALDPARTSPHLSRTVFTPADTISVPVPAPPAPSPPAPVGVTREQLPLGKGMFIYEPERTEFGNIDVIIGRARDVGLSHVWVRTGSAWDGFNTGPFLSALLPKAHAAGLRVYGWDFPSLADTKVDVARAMAAINLRAPDGSKLDGFAADIETLSEGTQLTGPRAAEYGDRLRWAAGPSYPLIAVVPRPSPEQKGRYPYAQVVQRFDAIAPMVYWLNRQPGPDVAGAIRDLRGLGKPIFPIGQAYDGAREGGRPGVPPRAELVAFMDVAARNGAQGVSFWVWQQANQETWSAIRDNLAFRMEKLL